MRLFDLNHGDDGDRVYADDDHRDGDDVNDDDDGDGDGDAHVHHHVITMHRQSL